MITIQDDTHPFHAAFAALDQDIQNYLAGCIYNGDGFSGSYLLGFSDEALLPLLALELRAAIDYLPEGSAPDALRRLVTDAANNRLYGGGFVQLLSDDGFGGVTGFYNAVEGQDVPCGCALGSLTIGSCLDGYTGPISEQIYLGLIKAAEVHLAGKVRGALYDRMLCLEHIVVTLAPGQTEHYSNVRRRRLIQTAAEAVLAELEA